MKETLNTVRVGLFFALGLAVIWIVYETLQEGRLFAKTGYSIYGEFESVKMLRAGDDVRVSGVRVGRVAETRLRNGRAEAVLEIDEGIRISRDSVATIAITSMLGSNHVAINFGTQEQYLDPGDRITTRHTADLNEIFAQMGKVGDQMDDVFGDLSKVFASVVGTAEQPGVLNNLNRVVEENRQALQESMDNIRDITNKINEGEGTLARLINDDTAYQSLLAAVDEITKAAEQASTLTNDAGEVMAHIRSGEGTLGSLIYGEELGQEIQAVATNLRVLSDRLAAGEGTIGRLLADDTLYRDIQGVIQKAERTIEGLNEQGPLTAAGIAAGALF